MLSTPQKVIWHVPSHPTYANTPDNHCWRFEKLLYPFTDFLNWLWSFFYFSESYLKIFKNSNNWSSWLTFPKLANLFFSFLFCFQKSSLMPNSTVSVNFMHSRFYDIQIDLRFKILPRILCKGNGVYLYFQMGFTAMEFAEDLRYDFPFWWIFNFNFQFCPWNFLNGCYHNGFLSTLGINRIKT